VAHPQGKLSPRETRCAAVFTIFAGAGARRAIRATFVHWIHRDERPGGRQEQVYRGVQHLDTLHTVQDALGMDSCDTFQALIRDLEVLPR
jgi:hypothetical protein